MRDLVLPAFEMDCRDWLVVTPADAGLPDEVAGAPLLAVLSTVVLGDESFSPASGVLTVGLLDDEVPAAHPMDDDAVAAEITDDADDDESVRFVLPAPRGRLALLAEFRMPDGRSDEVKDRIDSLMRSFRWAAAA